MEMNLRNIYLLIILITKSNFIFCNFEQIYFTENSDNDYITKS